ncbi:uncharacterized protein AMSG_09648 [Thecamonas trahens ATCC 50062]|uniref:PA14 domain-containing protein n=1 Tax=Thecamonas trahens ATCC 50062 TaxID=461836 RepID=A0A0L0DPP5_THETB|nr:hypothetical protein AMSG_09648 [Thecamonas trahens ATCC 50062]KNC53996.1 hypothetical protein AMSG_09648 [Thecamonas trahens ATCC 50062]|eukprot:XP_013754197.1 hypothetical protein AMSG_09648 [Thecamonas trahens ATCC 50062]
MAGIILAIMVVLATTVKGDGAYDTCAVASISGRLWSRQWLFAASSYTQADATDVSMWAIFDTVLGGRLVETRFEGLAGFVYELGATKLGIPSKTPSYKSALTSEGHTISPEIPLYLKYPTHVELGNTLPEVIFDGVVYVSVGCGEYSAECQTLVEGQIEPRFRFETDAGGGRYRIVCDTSGDGIFNIVDGSDTVLSGDTVDGVNEVPWDGKDASGVQVADGNYICEVWVLLAEVHFPLVDVETVYPGMRMYSYFNGVAKPQVMYWSDEDVNPAINMPNGEPGATTSGCCGVNSTYDTNAVPNVNARAWGNFVAGSKGDQAIINTFSFVERSVSLPISISVGATEACPEPTVRVLDKTIVEGDSGSTDVVIDLVLTSAISSGIAISYTTTDGTANGGLDYVPNSGVINMTPGSYCYSVTVVLTGDTDLENDEIFYFDISQMSGPPVTIAKPRGVITILNDDDSCPVVSTPPLEWPGLLMEVFDCVDGESIASLTSSSSYIDRKPGCIDSQVTTLSAAPAMGACKQTLHASVDYGFSLSGWLRVGATNTYTFYVAADFAIELWVGANEASLARVAYNEAPNAGPTAYTETASQASTPMALSLGDLVYIRVLYKEGDEDYPADDFFSVAWSGSGFGDTTEVIASGGSYGETLFHNATKAVALEDASSCCTSRIVETTVESVRLDSDPCSGALSANITSTIPLTPQPASVSIGFAPDAPREFEYVQDDLFSDIGAASTSGQVFAGRVRQPRTVKVRISSGARNAFERSNDGLVVPNFRVLGMSTWTTGLIFDGVDVPPGATITNAYIAMEGDNDNGQDTGTGVNIPIYAFAADTAGAMPTNNYGITSLAPTGAVVTWTDVPAFITGVDYVSPDISPVVQELVSRPGWRSGNDMLIVFGLSTGTANLRVIASFENPTSAPLLVIEYHTGFGSADTYTGAVYLADASDTSVTNAQQLSGGFRMSFVLAQAASYTVTLQHALVANNLDAVGERVSSLLKINGGYVGNFVGSEGVSVLEELTSSGTSAPSTSSFVIALPSGANTIEFGAYLSSRSSSDDYAVALFDQFGLSTDSYVTQCGAYDLSYNYEWWAPSCSGTGPCSSTSSVSGICDTSVQLFANNEKCCIWIDVAVPKEIPSVGLNVSTAAASEPGAGFVDIEIGLTLAFDAEIDIQVTLAALNGTAFAGVDFDLLSPVVNFPAGVETVPVIVRIYQDNVYEYWMESAPAETFDIQIVDTPTVSTTEPTDESGSRNVSITIVMGSPAPSPVTVDVVTSVAVGSLATGDVDFEVVTTTVTIPGGSSSAVFDAVVYGDAWYDDGETFDVTLTGVSGPATLGGTLTTVVTIGDSGPAPTLTTRVVSGADASTGSGSQSVTADVSEGDATSKDVVLELALSRPAEHPTVVDVVVYPTSTATNGTDVDVLSTEGRNRGPFTIGGLVSTYNVSAVIYGETVVEGTEVFDFGLVATYGVSGVTSTSNASVSIVGMAVAAVSTTEPTDESGSRNVSITIVMGSPAPSPVTVDVVTSVAVGSLATGDVDFEVVTTTVTIPGGSSSAVFDAVVYGDAWYDDGETFDVTLTGVSGPATLGGTLTTVVTIGDSGPAPTLTTRVVSGADASTGSGSQSVTADVSEGDATSKDVVLELALSRPAEHPTVVDVVVYPTSTATNGTDVDVLSTEGRNRGPFTIGGLVSTYNVSAVIYGETVVEGTEVFDFGLVATYGVSGVTSTSNASVSIVGMAVAAVSTTEPTDESGSRNVSITIVMGSPAPSPVTVDVVTSVAVGSLATGDVDFEVVTTTVTIPGGSSSAVFDAVVYGDAWYDDGETFDVTLTGVSGPATLGGTLTTVVTIGDSGPAPTLTTRVVSGADASTGSGSQSVTADVSEGDATSKDVVLELALSRPAEHPTVVDVVVYPTSTATNGTDVDVLSTEGRNRGPFTIGGLVSTYNVSAVIYGETVVEGTEVFDFGLVATYGVSGVTSTSNASVSIVNDDFSPPPPSPPPPPPPPSPPPPPPPSPPPPFGQVGMAVAAVSTTEPTDESGSRNVSITIVMGSPAPSPVTVDVVTSVAVGSLATGDVDFEVVTTTVTIPGGSSSAVFDAVVYGDAWYDDGETFDVTLTGVSGPATLGGTLTTVVTIGDSGPAPTLTTRVVSGADASTGSGSQSVTADVSEGDATSKDVVLELALSRPAEHPTVVDVVVYPTSTATNGTDVDVLSTEGRNRGPFTIGGLVSTYNVSAVIYGETVVEGTEVFDFGLVATYGVSGVTSTSNASVSIVNDDFSPPPPSPPPPPPPPSPPPPPPPSPPPPFGQVGMAVAAVSTTEPTDESGSRNVSITIVMGSPAPSPVTVDVVTSVAVGSLATGDVDFEVVTTTVTIPGGSSSAVFDAVVYGDAWYDDGETFDVTLTGVSGPATLGGTLTTVVTIGDSGPAPTLTTRVVSGADASTGSGSQSVTADVSEGDATSKDVVLELALSRPAEHPTVVDVVVYPTSTATNGTDVDVLSTEGRNRGPFTIGGLVSTYNVSAVIYGETVVEGTEVFDFGLVATYGVSGVTSTSNASVSIVNDDFSPPPPSPPPPPPPPSPPPPPPPSPPPPFGQVGMAVAAVSTTEPTDESGSRNVSITIVMGSPAPSPVTVDVVTSVAVGSLATGDVDFEVVTTTVTIPGGSSSAVFDAVVYGDAWYDDGETFDVTLTGVSGPATLGGTLTTVVTIGDSGPAPTLTTRVVSGADASTGSGSQSVTADVSEGDATSKDVVLELALSRPAEHPTVVDVVVYPTSTATNGTDVDVLSTEGRNRGPFTIGGLVSTYNVSAVIYGETVVEGTEVFDFGLVATYGVSGVTSTSNASVSIVNDDFSPPPPSPPPPPPPPSPPPPPPPSPPPPFGQVGMAVAAVSTTEPTDESGSRNVSITIVMGSPAPSPVTVDVVTSVAVGSLATGDVDFEVVTTTVTIPGGSSSAVFDAVVYGDAWYDDGETFDVTLTGVSGPATLGGTLTTVVTIGDSGPAPTLTTRVVSGADASTGSGSQSVTADVSEGDATSKDVVLELALSRPAEHPTVVDVVVYPTSTATNGTDVDVLSTEGRNRGPFTIGGLVSTYNVSAVIYGETVVEGTEVFDFGLVATYGVSGVTSTSNASVSIVNDDFSPPPPSPPPPPPPPSPPPPPPPSPPPPFGQVGMAVAAVSTTEPTDESGSRNVSITIVMGSPAPSPVTVDVVTSVAVGSLATGDVDFEVVTTTVTIPGGSSSAVFDAVVYGDAWYDDGETFDVTLTGVSGPATLGGTLTTVVTIGDSGPAPTLTTRVVSGADASTGSGSQSVTADVSEGDATSKDVVLELALSRPAEHPTVVDVVVYPTSTATNGTDVDVLSTEGRNRGPFTIGGLVSTYNVSAVIYGETVVEGTEVFDFGLVATYGVSGVTSTSNASVSIVNDDFSPPPPSPPPPPPPPSPPPPPPPSPPPPFGQVGMAVAAVSTTEPTDESGSRNVSITIVMGSPAPSPVTVDVVTSVAVGSLATGDVDFEVVTTTVTIPGGSSSAVFDAVVYGDAWYDDGETFDVTLTGVSGPATLGGTLTTVVTIGDSGPAPTLTTRVVSGADASTGSGSQSVTADVSEGDATSKDVVLELALSRPAEHPTVVDVVVYPTSTATNGTDVDVLSTEGRNRGPFTIGGLVSTYNVSAVIYGETVVEGTEVFDFGLVATYGVSGVTSTSNASVSIVNDDFSPPPPSPSLPLRLRT